MLRGTFYILKKQSKEAMDDFTEIIEDESCDVKIRTNALIKRASLYIQQCKDPHQDPLKGMNIVREIYSQKIYSLKNLI